MRARELKGRRGAWQSLWQERRGCGCAPPERSCTNSGKGKASLVRIRRERTGKHAAAAAVFKKNRRRRGGEKNPPPIPVFLS
jgi:hypothetical protein